MHTFIITGTSRGLGEALCYELLDPNHRMICVSRKGNPSLKAAAAARGCELQDHLLDLAHPDVAERWMRDTLLELSADPGDRLAMIHNAGLIHPIAPLGQGSEGSEVLDTLMVNLLSPMRMTEALVSITQDWPIAKQVIMISSGAGRKPMPSWSTYCTSKAGIDMFARCLAQEQAEKAYPIEVISLAPGVVDTEMQREIREQPESKFTNVARFVSLHTEGQLSSPSNSARQVISFLAKEDFGKNVIRDVRD